MMDHTTQILEQTEQIPLVALHHDETGHQPPRSASGLELHVELVAKQLANQLCCGIMDNR
jgi:hypothetical protein